MTLKKLSEGGLPCYLSALKGAAQLASAQGLQGAWVSVQAPL